MSPVAATAVRTVEVMRFQGETPRASQALNGFLNAAGGEGFRASVTREYAGGADWLLLWGPGAPNRFEPMRAQVAAGGHVAALDLAYWRRQEKVRVSIDAAHPQAYVLRHTWPEGRLALDKVPIEDSWDPDGPVIVAGIGRKAGVQYGAGAVLAWEAQMIDACRLRWPDRPVLYRRKQTDAPFPDRAIQETSAAIPIDVALRGCSLVVTWHSNVAVDAIRMGIPVVCRDGAASAVCPQALGELDPRPLLDACRRAFLANLAWFQWDPTSEASAFWRFLREVVA